MHLLYPDCVFFHKLRKIKHSLHLISRKKAGSCISWWRQKTVDKHVKVFDQKDEGDEASNAKLQAIQLSTYATYMCLNYSAVYITSHYSSFVLVHHSFWLLRRHSLTLRHSLLWHSLLLPSLSLAFAIKKKQKLQYLHGKSEDSIHKIKSCFSFLFHNDLCASWVPWQEPPLHSPVKKAWIQQWK